MQACVNDSLSYDLFPAAISKGDREDGIREGCWPWAWSIFLQVSTSEKELQA